MALEGKSFDLFSWATWTAGQRAVALTVAVSVTSALLLWRVFRSRLKTLAWGHDNRVSTSKLQPLLWTLSLVTGFIYAGSLALFDSGVDSDDILGEELQPEYLLLLGGPFAAALLARQIVVGKLEDHSLQKVEVPETADPAGEGEPAVLVAKKTSTGQQVMGDDGGRLDLIDFQYFLFNLVALGWFWVAFAQTPRNGLPSLPSTLVGLTSASALTFVGNKATLRNAPSITSIVPSSDRPDAVVKIRGRNFLPSGAPDATQDPSRGVAVVIGGFSAETVLIADNQVDVRIPQGTAIGEVEVQLTTAAGAKTSPVPFQIIEGKPVLFGLEEGRAAPGDTVHLLGRYFTSPRLPDTAPVVLFDEVTATANTAVDDRVEVELPATTPTGDVQVRVQQPAGARSDPVPFRVDPGAAPLDGEPGG